MKTSLNSHLKLATDSRINKSDNLLNNKSYNFFPLESVNLWLKINKICGIKLEAKVK